MRHKVVNDRHAQVTWARRKRNVIDAPTDNFSELTKIAHLDKLQHFHHADWSGVDFSGCNLRGFDFTAARLLGCKFDGAYIGAGPDAENKPAPAARFDQAELDTLLEGGAARTKLRAAADWDTYVFGWHVSAKVPADDHLPAFAVFQDAPFAPEMVVVPPGEYPHHMPRRSRVFLTSTIDDAGILEEFAAVLAGCGYSVVGGHGTLAKASPQACDGLVLVYGRRSRKSNTHAQLLQEFQSSAAAEDGRLPIVFFFDTPIVPLGLSVISDRLDPEMSSIERAKIVQKTVTANIPALINVNRPAPPVKLTRAIAIGRSLITNAQWRVFAQRSNGLARGSTQHDPGSREQWEDDDFICTSKSPEAAEQYVKWLSSITGQYYRLMGAREWEYYCRVIYVTGGLRPTVTGRLGGAVPERDSRENAPKIFEWCRNDLSVFAIDDRAPFGRRAMPAVPGEGTIIYQLGDEAGLRIVRELTYDSKLGTAAGAISGTEGMLEADK